jgi:hypothetical protein
MTAQLDPVLRRDLARAALTLNFATSISENDSIRTKKHINSVIKSANVMTQPGRPALGVVSGADSDILFRPRYAACSSISRWDFGR